MLIITPEMKDKVLEKLLQEDNPHVDFQLSTCQNTLGISANLVQMILNQFVDLELIKKRDYIGGSLIQIQVKAIDLYRHGGFTAEEKLFKDNLEKLTKELTLLSKQLEPKLLEKASQLAQIAGTLIQGLTILK